jgi:segregation and condensation protein B
MSEHEQGQDAAGAADQEDNREETVLAADSDEAIAIPPRPAPDRATLKRIIEGALLAAGETLDIERLGTLFEDHERPDEDAFRALLAELGEDYADRGIELREVASGFRIQVRRELGPWVSRLWSEKPPRYSRALMETLSLIAYRQPITRGEIEEIRGVTVSSEMIRTLLERDWVRVVGHRDVPGRPAMYATTRDFLDYFDLKSLEELPTLSEIRDLDKVNEELALVVPGAVQPAASEGAPTAAHQYLLGEAAEDEDLEISMDMQQVDEVLKRVEDSFRRPVAAEEGAPQASGVTPDDATPDSGEGRTG